MNIYLNILIKNYYIYLLRIKWRDIFILFYEPYISRDMFQKKKISSIYFFWVKFRILNRDSIQILFMIKLSRMFLIIFKAADKHLILGKWGKYFVI